ncbi:hypothetical protein BST61_g11507 [Cercospora zeina]
MTETRPNASSVAFGTDRALESFRRVKHLRSESDYSLADSEARFRIWAGNIGAYHTPDDLNSADYRLRDTPLTIKRLTEILADVEETNVEIANIVSEKRPAATIEDLEHLAFSESNEGFDRDGHPRTELGELQLSLEDSITSLLKVSALIRTSAGLDRRAYAQRVASRSISMSPQFDIAHVLQKYPKLARVDLHALIGLATKLGNALTQRRQYLSYARDHHDRLSGATSTSARQKSTAASIAALTLHASEKQPSSLQADDVVEREEVESQASSTQSSSAAVSEPEMLTVPELETLSEAGRPFECPFCYNMLEFTKQCNWRHHVLADLRAWTCLYSHCRSGNFNTFTSWSTHEQTCHRRMWKCPQCDETGFTDDQQLQDHLKSDHAVDSQVMDEVLLRKYAYASSPLLHFVDPANCPFCDAWSSSLHREREARADAGSSASITVPMESFLRHISIHQIQLALFVLPDSTGNDGTDGTSSKVIEDSQNPGSKAAMLSRSR